MRDGNARQKAMATYDAHIDAWRRHCGSPVAPPPFTPEQKKVFEHTADLLIGYGVAPATAAEHASDKVLGKGEYAPPPDGVIIGGSLRMASAMPNLKWVTRPLLTKGQLGTLTAHPGHGKTTFAIGLCVCQALGLAFGTIEPSCDGLVYIVSAEDFQGTRNRILAEAARLRLDTDHRQLLDANLRWVQVDTNVGASTIQQAIEQDCGGEAVCLIFVDTGPALFMGDDENDNVALRNFMEGFLRWRDIPGNPATLVAWHPSKAATADRLEPRGASAIKATTDFNLTLWKDDDRITLGYTKVRAEHFDALEGKIGIINIEHSGARFSVPFITIDTPDDFAARSDTKDAREAILKRLYITSAGTGSVRDLASSTNLSKSAVARHLHHLGSTKPALVTRDPVDDRYSLTKTGEARAKSLLNNESDTYAQR